MEPQTAEIVVAESNIIGRHDFGRSHRLELVLGRQLMERGGPVVELGFPAPLALAVTSTRVRSVCNVIRAVKRGKLSTCSNARLVRLAMITAIRAHLEEA